MSDSVSRFVTNIEQSVREHVKTWIAELLNELHDRIDNPPVPPDVPAGSSNPTDAS